MDRSLIPGATVMIVKDGKTPYYKAWGYRDIDDNETMQKDDIFRIASMSKAITSTAILQLHEKGKLNIEDPLHKFIPEFKETGVIASVDMKDSSWTTTPLDTVITLRHLLTHTSGIGYGFMDTTIGAMYAKVGVPDGGVVIDLKIQDRMKALANAPLLHRPGSQWTYGLSTDMLGAVVEIASGQDLESYFQEHIFKPLGMKDTYFYLPDNKANRLVTMYTEIPDSIIEFPNQEGSIFHSDSPIMGAKAYYSGGGGLNSTVYDYNVFLQAILNEGSLGGTQILKPETVQLMTTNQIGELMSWGQKFSLAFEIRTNPIEGTRPLNAYGWGGAFQTRYWVDPTNKMTVVIHTNVFPHYHNRELYDRFERAVYSAL